MILTPCFERQLVGASRDAGVDRLVVGAVVVRKGRVLLLRRKYGDFMGGLYELPSGLVEPDETLEEALNREVIEETGLQLVQVEGYLGYFNYVSGGGQNTRQFNFMITVGEFSYISLKEHDAFIWAQTSDLDRLRISQAVRDVLMKV
ncbi:MAG: NUDIX hydrolase [Chloroflexota bacterium]|nr:NUDIX hydrolase [Chloroflexota bacterium]